MIDWIIKPFFFFFYLSQGWETLLFGKRKNRRNVSRFQRVAGALWFFRKYIVHPWSWALLYILRTEKSLSKVTTTSNLYSHKFHFTSLFPSRVFIPFPVKGNLQFQSLTSMPPYVPHDIMGMSEWVIDLYFRWEKFCKGGRITVHLSLWRIYKPTDKLQDSLLWILSMVCMS